ncbi:Integral membrane protein [Tritrichomonas foetus]|uniref:Integral membrane protein n=1 Tax=Tritrichomonas foetus TaxID=1144522 RepID=A0A1J4J6N1_9EUKA|nr:Integral membrane protein [Tritrichomonas foetus]|eukprot:OHS92844.1 Integral membrane protein [Tritrichomonas foetus]
MWKEKLLSIFGFSMLSLMYGTSYGIAVLGLETYPGATLIGLRMIFAVLSSGIICLFRIIAQPKIRLDIRESVKFHKIDMLKSAFGGIMYYGFPHSLIGVAQRAIPSNTVHIAQSCVPFFAFIFANFMLADEKFSCKRFYPQLLALIGTVLTTIPTKDTSTTQPPVAQDYIFLVVAIASFGFGSVYMKSGLGSAEPTICGLFQLIGSAIYSVSFALAYDRPAAIKESLEKTTWVTIAWPFILGAVHTCGCAYCYLWTCKRLGAVVASFSNFGQIVVGVLIGIFFFDEWGKYKKNDFIMSGCGLFILMIAIICGFLDDIRPGKKDESTVSLISENASLTNDSSNREGIADYDRPVNNKPLLA